MTIAYFPQLIGFGLAQAPYVADFIDIDFTQPSAVMTTNTQGKVYYKPLTFLEKSMNMQGVGLEYRNQTGNWVLPPEGVGLEGVANYSSGRPMGGNMGYVINYPWSEHKGQFVPHSHLVNNYNVKDLAANNGMIQLGITRSVPNIGAGDKDSALLSTLAGTECWKSIVVKLNVAAEVDAGNTYGTVDMKIANVASRRVTGSLRRVYPYLEDNRSRTSSVCPFANADLTGRKLYLKTNFAVKTAAQNTVECYVMFGGLGTNDGAELSPSYAADGTFDIASWKASAETKGCKVMQLPYSDVPIDSTMQLTDGTNNIFLRSGATTRRLTFYFFVKGQPADTSVDFTLIAGAIQIIEDTGQNWATPEEVVYQNRGVYNTQTNSALGVYMNTPSLVSDKVACTTFIDFIPSTGVSIFKSYDLAVEENIGSSADTVLVTESSIAGAASYGFGFQKSDGKFGIFRQKTAMTSTNTRMAQVLTDAGGNSFNISQLVEDGINRMAMVAYNDHTMSVFHNGVKVIDRASMGATPVIPFPPSSYNKAGGMEIGLMRSFSGGYVRRFYVKAEAITDEEALIMSSIP